MLNWLYYFLTWLKIKIRLITNKRKKVLKEKIQVELFIHENKITNILELDILKFLGYIPEGLDWQKLAYETIKNGGGDCEDLHRVVQLIIKFFEPEAKVYLAQNVVKPLNKSHAFVIYRKDNKWYAFDYNEKRGPFTDYDKAIKSIMLNKYGAKKVLVSVITDEDWNFVKL